MRITRNNTLRFRFGREGHNQLLPFTGRDGLNQRTRGYWHKVWWFGPIFVSFVHDVRENKCCSK